MNTTASALLLTPADYMDLTDFYPPWRLQTTSATVLQLEQLQLSRCPLTLVPAESVLAAPPPAATARQELLPCEPVKTDVHRVSIQIPLPIILQPMRWTQYAAQMTGVLLLNSRLPAQILQHLLSGNPFLNHKKSLVLVEQFSCRQSTQLSHIQPILLDLFRSD